jgi:predicted MFS family arabinose efflux permease
MKMNNTTRFSIATLAALITVYALYFVGVLEGADFYVAPLDQEIPIFLYAVGTVGSAVGAFLVARALKKTENPSRNVWITAIIVFAFFILLIPGVADPIAAALLVAIHFAVAIPLTLAMLRSVSN